jgi:RNA polymerase sigma-70 factor, ECF subfamily
MQDTETPLNDAALAQRVCNAASSPDREAEALLCGRLAPRVRLYGLRHLRNPAAAADLMQQVMLIMIERLREGALREPDHLVSFVFGICRMVVLDLRRGQARRERLLEMYAEDLAPAETPAPSWDLGRLAQCLERLAERERTVLLLTFYDDMSADRMARELDLSAANIRVIRHRGLAHLRGCVMEEAE